MSKALSLRRKGQLPLSVATSIAIESLLNMSPTEDASPHVRVPKGDRKPIVDFKELWINLRTLLRNIDGAIDPDISNDASPRDYYKVVLEEIQILENLISELPEMQRPVLKFYTKTYHSLSRIWPNALFRDVTAPRLQVYATMENNVMADLLEDLRRGTLRAESVFSEDCYLTIAERSALISHFPIDLLLVKHGKFQALVESHTGAIKDRSEWNTKLRDGKKYPRIPFDRAMVQIFGDKENMLSPQTMQIRKKMAELSEKHNWNALTTRDRILFCVKQENEPVLYNLIKACYAN